jgi:hypothetical protein
MGGVDGKTGVAAGCEKDSVDLLCRLQFQPFR